MAYDPTSQDVSSIFVIKSADFKKMKSRDIQEVFRYRHILVLGVETEKMEFDLEGLSSLGSLMRPRSMQGKGSGMGIHLICLICFYSGTPKVGSQARCQLEDRNAYGHVSPVQGSHETSSNQCPGYSNG